MVCLVDLDMHGINLTGNVSISQIRDRFFRSNPCPDNFTEPSIVRLNKYDKILTVEDGKIFICVIVCISSF